MDSFYYYYAGMRKYMSKVASRIKGNPLQTLLILIIFVFISLLPTFIFNSQPVSAIIGDVTKVASSLASPAAYDSTYWLLLLVQLIAGALTLGLLLSYLDADDNDAGVGYALKRSFIKFFQVVGTILVTNIIMLLVILLGGGLIAVIFKGMFAVVLIVILIVIAAVLTKLIPFEAVLPSRKIGIFQDGFEKGKRVAFPIILIGVFYWFISFLIGKIFPGLSLYPSAIIASILEFIVISFFFYPLFKEAGDEDFSSPESEVNRARNRFNPENNRTSGFPY